MNQYQRIEELEQAITANDELMQKVEAENKRLRELNAELLDQLKRCNNWLSSNPESAAMIDEIRLIIVKAELDK